MRALVIGFGSIGQRHAHLLTGLGLSVAVVSRRPQDWRPLYPTIDTALTDFRPDYVVIASQTSEHRDDLKALADGKFEATVLVEKPVFMDAREYETGDLEPVYVAYNMRFHPVVRRLKEVLEDSRPLAVHAYVGQRLPDWRPGTDYRQSYSAIRALGGGVLRDLSHELDYLNWMLGGWTRVTALGGNFSDLEIDSDDIFSLLFATARCPVVSVHMNYLDRTLRREIIAITEKRSVRVDLVRGTIDFGTSVEKFDVERNDTYIAEHRAALAGDPDILCDIDAAMDVMRLIDAAENSVAGKNWIETSSAAN